MRGDSLRDLYAKVLALCGLGLLACAGALVDYWPVREDLPRVASLGAGAIVPAPVTPSVLVQMPAPVPAVVAVARRAETAPAPTPRVMPPEPLPVTTLAVDLPFGAAVDLAPPPVPRLDVRPEPAALPPSPAVEVPLSERPAIAALVAAPAPLPAADDGDGLLTGALKKTGAVAGASIVKTGDAIVKSGVVAGTSIMDVFRGLAGAVKKVSPFVP